MPKVARKKRVSRPQLHQPDSTFPWHIDDIVEMKSHEAGYRGAWFRVQIKKVRRSKNGKLFCTVAYKDYPDESEEEIVAIDFNRLSQENSLMIRPLPPPPIKESSYDEAEHLNTTHAVCRDYWDLGDLVDWWYHDCWWLAEVISVLGDGRFELKCPAPPDGEGGVYLARENDMRASLNWSIVEQWTAPPSRVPEMKQCARLIGPVFCQAIIPSTFLEPEELLDEEKQIMRNEEQKEVLKKEQAKGDNKAEVRTTSVRQVKRKSMAKDRKLPKVSNDGRKSRAKRVKTTLKLETKSEPRDIGNEALPVIWESETLSYHKSGEQTQFLKIELSDDQNVLKVTPGTENPNCDVFGEKTVKKVGSSGLEEASKSKSEVEAEVKVNSQRSVKNNHDMIPKNADEVKKVNLKRGRPIGRPSKPSSAETGTARQLSEKQSVEGTPEDQCKAVVKKQAKQKVRRKSLGTDYREDGPKMMHEAAPDHATPPMPCIKVEGDNQTQQCVSSSPGEVNIAVEQVHDIGIFGDKVTKQSETRTVGKRDEMIKQKGKCPQRGLENANRMEKEQRGFETDGILRDVKSSCDPKEEDGLKVKPMEEKRRRMKLKVSRKPSGGEGPCQDQRPEDETETRIVNRKEPAAHQGKNPVSKVDLSTELNVSSNDNRKGLDDLITGEKKKTLAKQSDALMLDQNDRHQKEPVRCETSGMIFNVTSSEELAEVPRPGETILSHGKRDIPSEGLSLSYLCKLQEPPLGSGGLGNKSRRGSILPEENISVPRNELPEVLKKFLKKSEDKISGRSTPVSPKIQADSIAEWSTEESGKAVKSQDLAFSVCCSLDTLRDGICISPGVLREEDFDIDIISVLDPELDVDSSLIKLDCPEKKPSGDVIVAHQSKPSNNGGSAQKLVDFSCLKNIVGKPVIKHKVVLGRKLVSHARKEIWLKGKALSKRRRS